MTWRPHHRDMPWLLERVKVVPSGCWEWQKSCNPNGYGQYGVTVDGNKHRQLRAHRLAYQLANGLQDLPSSVKVRHTCDNPPCCNPAHLISGTQRENVDDMYERRAKPNRCVLTREEVADIREAAASGPRGTKAELARKYGVSDSTISRIALGKGYRWIKTEP